MAESDNDFQARPQMEKRKRGVQRKSEEGRSCPVCETNLADFDEQAAASHANKCLDTPAERKPMSSENQPGKQANKKSKRKASTSSRKSQKQATSSSGTNRLKPKVSRQTTLSFRKLLPQNPVLANETVAADSHLNDLNSASPPLPPLEMEINEEQGLYFGLSREDSVVSLALSDELLDRGEPDESTVSMVWNRNAAMNSKRDQLSSIAVPTNPSLVNSKSSPFTSVRQCPWYKKLPNTGFTVDAFNCGPIEGCTAYFLSHFHADHYGGLTSKFSAGPIYCSQVTANLVKSQLRVDEKYVVALPMETEVEVQGVKIQLIDANHCPGAVLFLFKVPNPLAQDGNPQLHLHTGDFRALLPFHTSHPQLINARLDSVYLDTTYCDSRYSFPSQSIVLQVISELVVAVVEKGRMVEDVVAKENAGRNMMRQFLEMGSSSRGLLNGALDFLGVGSSGKKGTLVCVGTYTIGKERLAKALNCKVYAETYKRKILNCLEDEELEDMLTANPLDAPIHVVKIGQLNKEELEKKLESVSSKFSRILAIRPTGWTHHPRNVPATAGDDAQDAAKDFSLLSIKPTRLAHNIHVIPLPYSEHSSFTELKAFVKSLNVDQIIPTVNVARHEEMRNLFQSWRK